MKRFVVISDDKVQFQTDSYPEAESYADVYGGYVYALL